MYKRQRQGRGVLEHCGQEIRRFGKKAYIVSGPRAFDAVKDRLLPGLTEAGVEFVAEIYDGVCSYEAADALGKKCLDAGCDEDVYKRQAFDSINCLNPHLVYSFSPMAMGMSSFL